MDILPGIQKVMITYFNNELKCVEAILSNKKEFYSMKKAVVEDEVQHRIRDLRKSTIPYQWLGVKEVPFEDSVQSDKRVINIFDEEKNSVLLLRFKNDDDHLYDLVFLFLKKNSGNFGIGSPEVGLTTETKTAIGFLIHKQVARSIHHDISNQGVLKNINKRSQFLIDQLNQLKQDQEQILKEFGDSLVMLCNEYIKEFSDGLGVQFLFSQTAMHKISCYRGEISRLRNIIKGDFYKLYY